MKLDFTPLEAAIHRLEEGLARYRQNTSDTQIRDGLIQRFEFTYEMAHKTLRRYLAAAAANPVEVDAMTFADVIRTANEQGLLKGDWPAWWRYREMRSKTIHTYDEAIAIEVVAGIPDFLVEVRHLLDCLKSRSQ
jgi:nucleotidyltransferase substrate binding protein, HI0074 family